MAAGVTMVAGAVPAAAERLRALEVGASFAAQMPEKDRVRSSPAGGVAPAIVCRLCNAPARPSCGVLRMPRIMPAKGALGLNGHR
jgi:hypothetical protein